MQCFVASEMGLHCSHDTPKKSYRILLNTKTDVPGPCGPSSECSTKILPKVKGRQLLLLTFHDLPPSSMTARMEKKEFATQ